MKILEQYESSSEVFLNIQSFIDNSFLKKFVDEYKRLLQKKALLGPVFLEETKYLKIIFGQQEDEEEGRDFDLVFISYIVLLKMDFPNLEIGFYFSDFNENSNYGTQFYQVNHHRQHLLINGRREFFKLYKGDKEFKSNFMAQSGSYLPPLIITPEYYPILFNRKTPNNNYKAMIDQVTNAVAVKYFEPTNRDDIFSNFQNQYIKHKGKPVKWSFQDLSGLYFIRMLFDLYLLRYLINTSNKKVVDYKIGQTIMTTKADKESADVYRETIFKTLIEQDVFNLSDVEAYLLAILVRHNGMFKIPTSMSAMFEIVKPFLNEKEEARLRTNSGELRQKYIVIFNENLKQVINYTKDLAYGLDELSKNVLEHATSKFGVITGRIYQFNRITNLKSLEKEWGVEFKNYEKFLDLNIIDTGMESIKDSYAHSLEVEKNELLQGIVDPETRATIDRAYSDDLKEIRRYELDNFFNFNSIKLYHQINRTKARLGLIIFSQSIIKEKKALVHVSSNSLNETRPIGYYLYDHEKGIVERVSKHYMSLGTNYNFIIPLDEQLIYKDPVETTITSESGASSSVFLELHQFGNSKTSKYRLRKVEIDETKLPNNKYQKLDALKNQIGAVSDNEILIIDASKLSRLLTNSSDWVRFLANLQLTADSVNEIIVSNMDPNLYVETINILKLFDKFGTKNMGFWKKNRFILFFLAIEHEQNIFWFNSLLAMPKYSQFLKLNNEIALYHLNLAQIVVDEDSPVETEPLPKLTGPLFSSSGKLMNFELLVKNEQSLSLFEETAKSLLNLEIKD